MCTRLDHYEIDGRRYRLYGFSCPTQVGEKVVMVRVKRVFFFNMLDGSTWRDNMRVYWPPELTSQTPVIYGGKIAILFETVFFFFIALIFSSGIFLALFPTKK